MQKCKRSGETDRKQRGKRNHLEIRALRNKIKELKKKVDDQDQTIDYRIQARDEESDQIYQSKLKLADTWSIAFPDKAEKV